MPNTFYLRIACDRLHLTHLEGSRERRMQTEQTPAPRDVATDGVRAPCA